MVHPRPSTDCRTLGRENTSGSSFLSFLICKMGLGITPVRPHNFGIGSASPRVEGRPGNIRSEFSRFTLRPRHRSAFSAHGIRGMAGPDRVSPPAAGPGPTGSSKRGNLGFRQIQNNIIAVMSKGSRFADAPRLQ